MIGRAVRVGLITLCWSMPVMAQASQTPEPAEETGADPGKPNALPEPSAQEDFPAILRDLGFEVVKEFTGVDRLGFDDYWLVTTVHWKDVLKRFGDTYKAHETFSGGYSFIGYSYNAGSDSYHFTTVSPKGQTYVLEIKKDPNGAALVLHTRSISTPRALFKRDYLEDEL